MSSDLVQFEETLGQVQVWGEAREALSVQNLMRHSQGVVSLESSSTEGLPRRDTQ